MFLAFYPTALLNGEVICSPTNILLIPYAEVARRMGIDPRTVSKYANQEEFKKREKQKRKSPVMDPDKPILDKWIKEDLKKKRRIIEQLKECTSS